MGVSILSATSTVKCSFRAVLIACSCLLAFSAQAQFTITQDFKSNSAGNVTLGGAAKLTSGTIDPAGQGWLRLTEDVNNQVGYGFVNQGFPSTLGVLMDFEYVSWRVTNPNPSFDGGDGFSVFLFNDNITAATFSLGSRGGSLGYAQSTTTGNTGLAGGYVGVGIDEYGNFANCSEGKVGGQSTNCGTLYRDYISARGPAPTYAYIQGVNVGQSLDYPLLTPTRPTPTQFYRRVQVVLVPNTSAPGQFILTVKSTTTPGGTLTTLFGPVNITAVAPTRMKLGFAASTGGAVNKHEVRNLIITTPGNIRTQKLVNKPVAKVGDQLVYTVNVYNETSAAVSNLPLTDIFTPGNGFNITNVAFSGTAGNTATGYTSTSLSNATLAMQANSISTFTVTGTVTGKPANGILSNTAYVSPAATGISDGDPTNDTSTVSTQIIAPDLAITKTHAGTLRKGLSGAYTLTVNNVGVDAKPALSTVTVQDIVPAGMTAGTPSGSGWTFSKSGNNITATRSDVLAPGATYPPITIPVAVAVNAPDSITNTATVANEFDANTANNTASDVVDTRRIMDLQVVSMVMPPGKQGCLNVPYQVQVNIRNNGPDSAVNGRFNFSVPTALNTIALASRTITSGGGYFGTGSSVATTGYVDSVTLTAGATAQYIFNVTVTSPAPATLAIAQASLLRSATDLDVDASDPTIAVPTDPQHECDAPPSGGGCNNIMRDTTFVSPGISPAKAGPNQQLCGVTTTTMGATAPTQGTGTWSQLSGGPNTAVINNINLATTGISNLVPGSYTFVWAISSGGCGTATDTMHINVSATPTVADAGPDQQLCNVATTTLSGNTPTVGTGVWQQVSGPNNAVFADTTLSASGLSGLTTGTYNFVWTIRNGSCPPSKDSVQIVVNPLPTTANAGPGQQLCNVTTTTLGGNTATSGTGVWKQISGPSQLTFGNVNAPGTTIQNLAPGIYSLAWTISSGNCPPSADTVQILVYASPDVPNAGPDQTKYNNGTFVIDGNTPVNGHGTWAVIGGTATIASPSSPSTTATLQPNTSATLTWTISNGNCPPRIDTLVLNYIRQADLRIIKSDAGNNYKTNGPLTYTITVDNLGPSNAYGFTLQDALPAGMSNASWSSVVTGTNVALRPTAGTGSSVTASGDLPFAAGNKIVITVTGTVASSAVGGAVISNTATVTPPVDVPDPVPGNNTSSVTGTVPNNPPVAVNDTVYTIRDVAVSGNVLTNDSDPEKQPITVSPTLIAQPTSGTVVQRADGTFTYTPNPGFTGTDSYIYQVCDNQAACSQATVYIIVKPGHTNLSISKTANPATATAGAPLTYTLTITNNGPSTIQSGEVFTVTDTLPNGFIADTYTASAGSYTSVTGAWTGVQLAPGNKVTLTIAGHVTPQFAGNSLTNTATAVPPATIPDSTTATATIVTPVTRSVEVVVTKTDNTDVYTPGTSTTYTITIVNKGPSALTGATFRDPLPAGITTASWTAVAPAGSLPKDSGTGPVNQVINIPAGGQIVYTLTIGIPGGYTGPLTNTATVDIPSGYNNINPVGNNATDTDTYSPKYSLSINKTGPSDAIAGTAITYQLQLVNNGPSDVTNAVVADVLPAAVNNPTWTVTAAGSAAASQMNGSGNVSFNATLPAGAGNTITVTITGTINPGATGILTNTASITSPGGTPVNSNTINTVLANTTGLTLVKQGPASGHVTAGASISYLIKLTNAGPSNAVGVQLKDVVPANITGVTWSVATGGTATVAAGAPANGSGNNISTAVNIPVGAANIVTLQVNGIVLSSATDTLLNTATAGIPGDTTVTAFNKTIIDNKPVLQVVKSGPASADAGTPVTYTISVTNTGLSDAVGAVISDVVANMLTGVTWNAVATGVATINSGANGNGNTISVNANIPAGAANGVTITIQGTLSPSASGTLHNEATIAVNGQPPVSSNEVITKINNNPGLSLVKTGPATGTAGGTLLYLVKIVNNGPSDAVNAVFTDTIPAAILNPGVSAIPHGSASVVSRQVVNGIAQVIVNVPVGDANSVDVFILGKIDPAFAGKVNNQAVITTAGGTVTSSNVVTTNIVNKPVLSISKTGKDTAVAGQPVAYSVTVENNGLSDATNVSIQDMVPATLTNVSWTASAANGATISSGATGSSNTVNVTGNIPAGKQAYIVINIQGTVPASFTGSLSNFATGTVNGGTPQPSDTVVTYVASKSALQIVKSGPATVEAGDRIHYVLQVTNTGPSDAVGVNITDTLNVIVKAASWTAAGTGGATVTAGAAGNGNMLAATANIPAGNGIVTVTVDGTVDPGAAGTLTNTASAGISGTAPVTSSTSAVITNSPAISISKTGPPQARAGENISYTLVVTNYGKSNAKDVLIQDIVPPQVSNVAWTASVTGGGGILSGVTGTGNDIVVHSDLNAGTANHVFINVTGKIAADFTGQLLNTTSAVVNKKDTARSDTVVTNVLNAPGIQVVKTAPDTVFAGGPVTYTIVATNIGPSDAPAVTITDALPAVIRNVSWTATAAGTAGVQSGSGSGSNNIAVTGSIPAGAGNNITITITGTTAPSFTGTVNNIALATPAGHPAVPSNNTSTQVVRRTMLTVAKSAPAKAAAGETVIYSIRLGNNGPSDATGVNFADTVAANIRNVSWTAVASGSATVTSGASGTGNQIALGANIPAGANSVLITVQGTIDPSFTGTSLRNIAVASSADQPNGVRDTATIQVMSQSLLQLSKNGPGTLFAGEQVTYTIHLENNGPSDARNVHITDPIDPAILNPAWTAMATGSGATVDVGSGNGNISVNCNLPAGQGYGIDITVKGTLNPDFTGTNLANTATAAITGQQPVSASVNTVVKRRANLRVVKSGPGTAIAGENITYTITVNNIGPSNAKGVLVTDFIPAAILHPVWTATTTGTATVSAGSGSGNVNLSANLPADGVSGITITVNGAIDPSTTNNSGITNNVTATPPADFENPQPVTSSVITSVHKQADLVIIKSGPANIAAGQTLTYQLEITNRGISNVTGATIADMVPNFVTIHSVSVTTSGNANNSAPVVNGNSITLTGDIAAGAGNSIIVTINGAVDPSATGAMNNTATVTAPPDVTETVPANNTSSISTAITTDLGLQVSKSGPATVNVGDTISYTIVVDNTGISDANPVVITDVVPTAVTNVVWTATATGNATVSTTGGTGNNIAFNAKIGGTNNSGTVTIRVKGVVDPLAPNTIVNMVTAAAGNIKTSTVVTSVNKSVDLRINKTAPATMAAGEKITYVIAVRNAGPADATGATISDAVPAAIKAINWTTAVSGGATVTPANGNTNTINLTANIPAGTGLVTITVNGVVDPAFTGVIVNTATAQPAPGVIDPLPATVTVNTNVTASPGILIVKSGPANAIAGDTMSYLLEIRNNGPSAAAGVAIADTLAAALTNVTWSATGTNVTINGPASGSGNIVKLNANIPVGGLVTVRIGARTDPGFEGSLVNTAVAGGVRSNEVSTLVQNQPGLTIRKSGPAAAAAGKQISYAVIVGNNGLSSATGVTISDLLPAGLHNVIWSASANGKATISGGNISNKAGNVNFKANIPAGAGNNIVVNISGTIDAAATGNLVNVATVAPVTGPAMSDTVTTALVTQTGIRLLKAAPDSAAAGSTITYTVDVYNDGPSDAVKVNVADALPAMLSNVTWSAVAGGTAAVNGGNLQQQTGNVAFTASIPAGIVNVVHVIITGTLKPDFTGPVNNQATATAGGNTYISNKVVTQVYAKPGLGIVKSGPTAAVAGSTITYSITLNNEGPSDAAGVVIADLLPAMLQKPVWSATSTGNASIQGGNIKDSAGNVNLTANIPAGAANSILVTVSGTIQSSFSGNITNTASFAYNGTTTVSTPVITTVTRQSALHISKSAPDTIAAGNIIHYTLQVTNDGPSDADTIVVSDMVPATITNVNWNVTPAGTQIYSGASGSGNNVIVTAGLPAGPDHSILVNITGLVPAGVTGLISNSAVVKNHNTIVTGDSVITQVVNKPGIQFAKSGPRTANAGDEIVYVINVENTGPSDLRNGSIMDVVPPQVQQVTWKLIPSGNAVLAPGTAVTGTGNQISFHAAIPAGAGNGVQVLINGVIAPGYIGNMINTAQATDDNGAAYTSSVTTTVINNTLLVIQKTGPDTVNAGDAIAYVISANNQGPSDAKGITLTDIVPAGITNISWTATASGSAVISGPAAGNSGNITVTGDIPAGSGNDIQIIVNGIIPSSAAAGQLTNNAVLKKADGTAVTASKTTVIRQSSRLNIEKVAQTIANGGDSLRYTIVVSNNGPSDANGVMIRDIVSDTLTGVSWTAAASGKAHTSINSGTGNVQLTGDISAGAGNAIVVLLKGRIKPEFSGAITNTATATDANNNTVSSTVTTRVMTAMKFLDLSVAKSGPASVFNNDSVTYVITASNAGPSAGDGAVITDILPVNIEGAYGQVLAANGGAGGLQMGITGNVLKVTIGSFPSGASLQLAITGKVNSLQQLRNTATITPPGGTTDANTSNNTTPVVITDVSLKPMADLQLQKILSNAGPLQVGGLADFLLTLNNAGPFTAPGVMVTDTLANNLEVTGGFNASIGSVSYNPGTRIIVWTLDSLQLMQTATLKFTTRVTNIGTVVNSAVASAALPDPNLTNNRATTTAVTVTGDDIFIPNVITPNGDGKNDKFIITGLSRYPNSSLFIYNRWGNMVYQSKDYQNTWDGNSLNEGTYYYILKLRTSDGERDYKGWIELLR